MDWRPPRPRLRLQLRRHAVSENGSANGKEKFVRDFVAARNKVMNFDRFDVVWRLPIMANYN
jgi:hypothetical protein